ncbi:hypothetical protein MCT03_05375 [Vibrio aestuarianus]|nr:hypothetical protein [Vibrio aestuarianus]
MVNYIFRALPLKRDARTQRYSELLDGNTVFNTWEERYESNKSIEKLKRGRSENSKIISYPLYLIYLFLFSLLRIRKSDRVICMELDTFIPIFLGSFWKNSLIYLDVVDPVGQAKFRKVPFNKFFDYIEYLFLRCRKLNILPNENRLEYYKDRLNVNIDKCKYLLVENVPMLNNIGHIKQSAVKFDIGYFGTLDESRGIKELIEYASALDISLLIAGIGPMEDFILQKSSEIGESKLKFYGSFSIAEIEKLYSMVNFSWAYYTDRTMLHKYASPNKYYEHLAFKTPMIMNQFVPLSNRLALRNTGVVIGDQLDKKNFIILNDKITEFNHGESDFSEWESRYNEYCVDFNVYERS